MFPTARLPVIGAVALATVLAGMLGLFAPVGGGGSESSWVSGEGFSGVHQLDPAARLENVEEDSGDEDGEREVHLATSMADGSGDDSLSRHLPPPSGRFATGIPHIAPHVRGPPARG